jgi:hypothetical protein
MFSPYFRCDAIHAEVRWARPGGEYCWLCGAAGRPFAALTVTSIDALIRDLDDLDMPRPAA